MVHTHRDEGFAYWPRCEEFGGVKTKHKAFNPILEEIDLLKTQIENKKEVRKMKIFKKLEKDCKTCKYMDFSEDFPLDPVCDVELANGSRGDGIKCCREKTWRSWEKRSWFKRRREGKVRKVRLRELDLKKAEELQSIFSQADIDRAYNNSNAQGLQEYIEFLKNDISESTGIPTEVLFGSNQEETPPTITYNGRECRIVDYKIGVDRAIDNGVVVIYTLEDIETQERYEVVGDGRLEMFQILHSSSTGDPSSYLSTKIQLNKKDIDCWKDKRLSLLQRLYKKLFPIRWEVKEKVKVYETKYLLKNLTKEVDRFIAYGDTLQPMSEGGIITEQYLNRVNQEIEGRRLVTEEQHLLGEGLRRDMEEQMRQAVLQNGMIPRSHGREHIPRSGGRLAEQMYNELSDIPPLLPRSHISDISFEEWQAEMMQNPQPTPEPQNYGNLQSYLLRQGLPLTPSSGLEANRITEAIREASSIISGIIGNRVGDMYNGRDDMYSERLERLCYTMVNRMITPNFTLNSIEYINHNEREFLESIRFSQRTPIVRDGPFNYSQPHQYQVYKAQRGDRLNVQCFGRIEEDDLLYLCDIQNNQVFRKCPESIITEAKARALQSANVEGRVYVLKVAILKPCTVVIDKKEVPKYKPKEFKVSDLITLRLESTDRWVGASYNTRLKTQIYIKGVKFRACKYLLLNLEYGNEYEDIESIDDAAEKLGVDHPNRDMEVRNRYIILPEEEFWGHASNLQVFVEYDYDLRVLHSNLSLPLLKELAQYDDHAKLRLKEQIAEKVEKGGYKAWKTHHNIIWNYFTDEERETLKKTIKDFPIQKRIFVDLINKGIKDFVSKIDHVYTSLTLISPEKIRNAVPKSEMNIIMNFPEIEHWICPSDAIKDIITLRDNEDKVFKIDISNLKIPKNLIKSREISLDELERELEDI